MENWERLIERHGLAVTFLVVVLVAGYLATRYIVVPLINRLVAALEKQIEDARAARKEDQSEFLSALERRDRLSEEQLKAFAEALRLADAHRGRNK